MAYAHEDCSGFSEVSLFKQRLGLKKFVCVLDI